MNILIRGVNWIGDAVMTVPAIRALRKAYPESKISLLVKPSVSPIFEKDPNINEIILYDEKFKGISGRLRLAMELKKKNFSKAILLQNAFDAALIAFLSGIPDRIGYNRDGRGVLLNHPVPFKGEDRKIHHIDYYLNLLRHIEINADEKEPWIYLGINERLEARNKLSILKRPILGINPGATYGSAKRWLPERFAEVAKWFIKDTSGSVVIFGSKKEVEMADEIFIRVWSEFRNKEDILNLSGKTSLRQLISLISECDLFVTNDSGPMHIAYAVGTPVVAVFGSTDPNLTGPVGVGNIVVKADFDCSPCFERTCKDNDMKCMYAVTSDDVYLAIKKLIPTKKAVFFDRDGTLCKDADYLSRWEDLEIFSEVSELNRLKNKGFLLIGVTNQSGIARGIVNESFVKDVNQIFINEYGFDDFYYCPHHPDENCSCRKPEPKMLFKARAVYKINLKDSFVVGDKDADMLLAKAVGAKGIFVKTGRQQDSDYADYTVSNLREAIKLLENYE